MQFSMAYDQVVKFSIAPTDSAGHPSSAVLSAVGVSSDNPAVFTVATDPNNLLGGIITGVAVGQATLSITATATEADTKTEVLSASVAITLKAGVASQLVVTFGTPTP